MPYVTEYVKPAVFFEYNFIRVYHVYKNNDYDNPRIYQFSLHEDDDSPSFDVRELKEYSKKTPEPTTGKSGDELKKLEDEWRVYFEKAERKQMLHAIKCAINSGELSI